MERYTSPNYTPQGTSLSINGAGESGRILADEADRNFFRLSEKGELPTRACRDCMEKYGRPE